MFIISITWLNNPTMPGSPHVRRRAIFTLTYALTLTISLNQFAALSLARDGLSEEIVIQDNSIRIE